MTGLSFLLPILFSLLLPGCGQSPQPQHLPTVQVGVGARTLSVELACTPAQRKTGMMHRHRISADEGMLFVFPFDEILSFYMRDTYVPLDIAFIRSDGVIANISHMEPLSLQLHESRLPCRYALEMPQGWFEKRGVREGAVVTLPEGITPE